MHLFREHLTVEWPPRRACERSPPEKPHNIYQVPPQSVTRRLPIEPHTKHPFRFGTQNAPSKSRSAHAAQIGSLLQQSVWLDYYYRWQMHARAQQLITIKTTAAVARWPRCDAAAKLERTRAQIVQIRVEYFPLALGRYVMGHLCAPPRQPNAKHPAATQRRTDQQTIARASLPIMAKYTQKPHT